MHLPKCQFIQFLAFFTLIFMHDVFASSPNVIDHLNITHDFSHHDFEQSGPVELDGKWEFYWQQLLEPKNFNTKIRLKPDAVIEKPLPWTNLQIKGEYLPFKGYATYRTQFILPEQHSQLGMNLSTYPTSVKIFINGKPVYQNGVPGKNEQTSHVGDPIGKTVFYQPTLWHESGPQEIIVQIANYRGLRPGYTLPLQIDDYSRLSEKNTQIVAVNLFMIGALMIMGVYHLGIYIIRRREKASLMLGITCLIFSLYFFTPASGLIYSIMPIFSGLTGWYLFNFSWYASAAAFIAFTYLVFEPRFNKTFFYIMLSVSGFGLFSLIFLPLDQISLLGRIQQLNILVFFTYSIVVAVTSLKHSNSGARTYLISLLILLLASINDLLLFWMLIDSVRLISYGCFLFICGQSFLLARRYSMAFNKAEECQQNIQVLNNELRQHNQHLDQLVNEKSYDIKTILNAIQQGILSIETEDGEVGSEYSPHLEKLIGTADIAGHNFYDLLFSNANFTRDKKNQILGVISSSVGHNQFGFDVNSHLLPREAFIELKDKKLIYEFDWNPIVKNEIVTKLLLVVRDVTELRALELAASKQSKEIKIIREIINIPCDKFNALITSSLECTTLSRALVDEISKFNPNSIQSLCKNMHTIKGLAGTYDLTTLSEAANSAEKYFDTAKKNKKWNQFGMREELNKVKGVIEAYLFINKEKLAR